MTDEPKQRRLSAYYYGFSPTGSEAIDKILGAVACAGKSYHSTENWCESVDPWEDHTGETPADWIQNAAKEAADTIARLTADVDRLERERQDADLEYKRALDGMQDKIARLTRERDDMESLCEQWENTHAEQIAAKLQCNKSYLREKTRAETAEAKLAEAVKVIGPFAAVAPKLDECSPVAGEAWPNDACMGAGYAELEDVCAGHFRAARTFLASLAKEPQG